MFALVRASHCVACFFFVAVAGAHYAAVRFRRALLLSCLLLSFAAVFWSRGPLRCWLYAIALLVVCLLLSFAAGVGDRYVVRFRRALLLCCLLLSFAAVFGVGDHYVVGFMLASLMVVCFFRSLPSWSRGPLRC